MKMASKQGKSVNSIGDISSSSAQKKRKIEDINQPESSDPNTTVVSYKPKPDISALGVYSSGDEWPFEGLCEQLSFDLFSPKWETRHGAAIGLRQLLKVQGSGLGKVVGIDKNSNEERHLQVLEDLAIRLLCVLALDQFADFVGDQAVVPVRETCAQTLGVVMQFCSPELCLQVVNQGLLKLIFYPSKASKEKKEDVSQKWAVRLAALIGLKYWMAVRQDLLNQIMVPNPDESDSPAFAAIIDGLKDHNDDVRAVATSSLIPISGLLVEILPAKKVFHSIVVCLWDSLQELDDLTSATSFVMDLLSDLLKKPVIATILQDEATQFLEKLVPQLYPFFRHAIASVRLAVLRSLITLTHLSLESNTSSTWIKNDLIRLLFQNFVLEERSDVLDLSLALWAQLCKLISNESIDDDLLNTLVTSTLPVLYGLLMSPIGTPIDPRLCISYTSGTGSIRRGGVGVSGLNIPPQDRAMMNQDLIVVSVENVMKGRLAGASAIGQLVAKLSMHPNIQELQSKLFEWINAYILSGQAFHRIFAGVVIQHWVDSLDTVPKSDLFQSIPLSQNLWSQLVQILADANAGGTLLFFEIQAMLAPLYQDCTNIQTALLQLRIATPPLPPLQSDNADFFSVESAEYYLDSVYQPLMHNVPESLQELYRKANNAKIATKQMQIQQDTRVYASIAAAVVSMGILPPKLNPIIRNLMSSVQTEENYDLQCRSANAVARMLYLNVQVGGKTNTNDKIVKNCCAYLCSDSAVVGILAETQSTNKIVTMAELQAIRIVPKRGGGKKKAIDIDSAATEAVKDAVAAADNEQERIAKKILHQGAESVIEYLCKSFQGNVFVQVPAL
jgi:TATA-binding protein-associated factor